MSNIDNQNCKAKYGYYRISVNADGDNFVEASFYSIKDFSFQTNDFPSDQELNDREKIIELSVSKVRFKKEVLVRDFNVVKSQNNIIKLKANEIIDPIDQSFLGNYVEFIAIPERKTSSKVVTTAQPAQQHPTNIAINFTSEEIDPPHQLPIINRNKIHISGNEGNEITIRVHDLKLGEFSFNTNTISIDGVDLRVQGNKISLIDECIFLGTYNREPENVIPSISSNFILIVRGSKMHIGGVRADNIDDIRIFSDKEFSTKIERITEQKKESKKDKFQSAEEYYKLKNVLIFLFIVLLIFTALPCVYFICNNGNDKAKPQGELGSQTSTETNDVSAVVPTPSSTPVEQNDLDPSLPSKQTFGKEVVLNNYNFSLCGRGSISNNYTISKNDRNIPAPANNNLLIMIVAALLYISFYCIIAYLMLKVLHEFNRQGKMTRDMSGVLTALENEKNKDKRLAMQKKILDDMINTYLDKRNVED